MKHVYKFLCALLIWGSDAIAQYTSDVTLTPAELVNILVGTNPNVFVSGVTGSWEEANEFLPVGSFTATGTSIGISSGVIMTTGSATTVLGEGPGGPASNTLAVMGYDGAFGSPATDQDLTDASGYTDLFDMAALEFDFTACADSVKFRYVFASEEYPDWVCSPFNDAFAFILSGVTTTLPPTNIALIPGTTTPVSINTVNGGVVGNSGIVGGCGGAGDPGLSNLAYYVDNLTGLTISYNGFTTVLTAGYPIISGELYHIKLVIADVSDGILDSGVFLEAGSFVSTPLPLDLVSSLNSTGGILDTACTKQEITVTNASVTTSTLTYNWDFDGATVTSGSGKGPFSLSWNTPGTKKVKCTLDACDQVSDSLLINVKICDIQYPNVFSPNNDGINDVLVFTGLELFPNSKLLMYNRWGKKIYENSNYKNDWKAEELTDGVYYYVIELETGATQTGYISVFRKI